MENGGDDQARESLGAEPPLHDGGPSTARMSSTDTWTRASGTQNGVIARQDRMYSPGGSACKLDGESWCLVAANGQIAMPSRREPPWAFLEGLS